MNFAKQAFLVDFPEPIWIYDLETLRFVDVNKAAIALYGYSREEFMAMTLADIRPEEDVPILMQSFEGPQPDIQDTGTWRHRLKSGEIIHTQIISQVVTYQNRHCRMVSVRNVTALVEMERRNAMLLDREREARCEAQAAAHHFQSLFEAVPGQFIVLRPEDFVIAAVSDAFLDMTQLKRDGIKGREFFSVFPQHHPDKPDAPSFTGDATHAPGGQCLRLSLERVRDTGDTDVLSVVHLPIPCSDACGGGSMMRYWSAVCTPLRGPDGKLAFIIMRAEDVTDFVQPSVASEGPDEALRKIIERDQHIAFDIQLRAREMHDAQEKLHQREAVLRNAQRLIRLGAWELDLATGVATWTPEVYELFGVSPEEFDNTHENFLALVHPDDRANYIDRQAEVISSDGTLVCEYRIKRPDGEERLLRETGEVYFAGTRKIYASLVQDITDLDAAEERAEAATGMMRLSGRLARLGGWRIEKGTWRCVLNAEALAIAELPDGTEVTAEDTLGFYLPAFRDRVRTGYLACMKDGTPYDATLQLRTAKGQVKWVRTMAEAERDRDGKIRAVRGAIQDITEDVAMRERSQSLAARMMQTLENMNDGFYALDAEWRFVFLNGRAEQMLRGGRNALIGRDIWEAFPAAVNTIMETEYRAAIDDKKSVRFSFFYPEPLNSWYEVNAHPDQSGGLAVYFRDITQERADQQGMRLLRVAAENQIDGLLITEAGEIDGEAGPRIIFANDAFLDLVGYTREEVIGQTPRFLQGPKSDRATLDKIRHALKDCVPVNVEILNYAKDGREIWFEINIVPIFDDEGKATHFVAVQRDMTERRAAEDAVRISNDRFRLVAQATGVVIWDCDIAAEKVWWSDGLETVLGLDPEEYAHPDAFDQKIHEKDRDRIVSSLNDAFEDGSQHWSGEFAYEHPDGRIRLLRDQCTIMRDETGRMTRVVGSIIDVTAAREAEMQLRQSQKLDSIGQLTGGVAHDFNNLLTIILGNAELLEDKLPDGTQLHAMAAMTGAAAQRGAELVSRLLSFSRKQPLAPRPTDLNALMQDMDGMIRRTIAEDIEIALRPGEALWNAEIDRNQCEVALLNIVINARDAMPSGGALTIETHNVTIDDDHSSTDAGVPPGEYVMIAITDDGIGMTADVAAQAFEPFFTTKLEGKGSGLGLSMVYGFLRQSGGHVRLDSAPGQGTTVRLYFPRSTVTEQVRPVTMPDDPMTGGSEHILIVEDNDLVRDHVVALTEGLGYRVTSAANGQEALALLNANPDVALLFSDVVMPGGLNGPQLAEAARQIRPDLRVLFTSGYSENAIVHQGRLDEGVQLLSKPYRRKELAYRLRDILSDGEIYRQASSV